VVASLWPVSDTVATNLMTGMYRDILAPEAGQPHADGLEVARALAAAMRHELAQAPDLDPGLWAPFTVYVGQ